MHAPEPETLIGYAVTAGIAIGGNALLAWRKLQRTIRRIEAAEEDVLPEERAGDLPSLRARIDALEHASAKSLTEAARVARSLVDEQAKEILERAMAVGRTEAERVARSLLGEQAKEILEQVEKLDEQLRHVVTDDEFGTYTAAMGAKFDRLLESISFIRGRIARGDVA